MNNGKSWLENVPIQRKTLYSNGLLIETDDSKRLSELLDKKSNGGYYIALTEEMVKKYKK